MDKINVLVAGNKNVGKTMCVNALNMSKLIDYQFDEYRDEVSIEIADIPQKYDLIFYIFELTDTTHINFVNQLVEQFNARNNCVFVPILNKSDLLECEYNEKTKSLMLADKNEMASFTMMFNNMQNIFNENKYSTCFNDKQIICSFEYAYMYLTMRKLDIEDISDQIKSKIGQYEVGKQKWSKMTGNQKHAFIETVIARIKKPSKLTESLLSFGYDFKNSLMNIVDNENFLERNATKYYYNICSNIQAMIHSEQDIMIILNTAVVPIHCKYQRLYDDIDKDELKNMLIKYVDEYDYANISFQQKCNIIKFFKENIENDLLTGELNSCIVKTTEILETLLTHEIETQLENCNFDELLDKLSVFLQVNPDFNVGIIILNHASFIELLFNPNFKQYIKLIFSRFTFDQKTFLLSIMNMKLNILFKLKDINKTGIIEHMMVVHDYLETNRIDELKQYRILLKCGIYKQIHKCEIELLKTLTDNTNGNINDLYYVEKKYCDLTYNIDTSSENGEDNEIGEDSEDNEDNDEDEEDEVEIDEENDTSEEVIEVITDRTFKTKMPPKSVRK